jgi:hypothetical protein
MEQLLTTTSYNAILAFLKNKAEVALPTVNVFDTPQYFASPQDFAAVAEETFIKPYKARYLMFSYGTFQDLSKGCDDNPAVNVTFKLQLYRTFQQFKTGGSSSHNLLVNDFIVLRNAFLQDRVIISNNIEHNALTQTGDLVLAGNSEYILNDVGDWMNFRLTVEVNNG